MGALLNFLKRLFTSATLAKNNQTSSLANILAAKVLAIEKHPNADRLRIVKLDLKDKIIYPVICGAFNFQEGDIVALALPGAVISQNIHSENHKSFTLGKAKIRGIESQGMICSAFELGLSKQPDKGIVLLKENASPGSQFSPEMIK